MVFLQSPPPHGEEEQFPAERAVHVVISKGSGGSRGIDPDPSREEGIDHGQVSRETSSSREDDLVVHSGGGHQET